MHRRPVVIVEDDHDDCDMLSAALTAIGIENEFRCFDTPVLALRYLRETNEDPFLIIADINMPFMTGLEFKAAINTDHVLTRIPFVFLTTTTDRKIIDKAFSLCAQGYFQKPRSVPALKEIAKSIVDYWLVSQIPKSGN